MNNKKDAIAIIGLSCFFPKSPDIKSFWRNLKAGKDCITHFKSNDFDERFRLSPEEFIKARGILDDIESFDANFFNLSPEEAAIMDPQHRLFLEKSIEALENAACDIKIYPGKIGVFAAAAESTYRTNYLLKNTEFLKQHFPYRTKILTDAGFLSTRVSYLLNLTGPSININTACSSGLTNVIYACKSLEERDCDIAIAGAVSIHCPQIYAVPYKTGGILSSDGVCRPFDEQASGTTNSNGLGIVVLKRLQEAIDEGDPIIAAITGFAINNDGASKVGYTAPSVEQQAACIQAAIKKAKIDPKDIQYIETHGTATPLGDMIEIAALKKVFSLDKNTAPHFLGSVKSNIGHTDMASGMAGLIKSALCLQHKMLVPSIHFSKANPRLGLEDQFRVNTEFTQWDARITKNHQRIASINSLGIGGTNTHLILEEFSTMTNTDFKKPYFCIVLSAHTEASLIQYQKQLLFALEEKNHSLANVAYTLALGRTARRFRQSYIVSTVQDLKEQLIGEKKSTDITSSTGRYYFLLNGFENFTPTKSIIAFLTQSGFVFRKHFQRCVDLLPTYERNHWEELPRLRNFILLYVYFSVLHDMGFFPAAYLAKGDAFSVAIALKDPVTLESLLKMLSKSASSQDENQNLNGATLLEQVNTDTPSNKTPKIIDIQSHAHADIEKHAAIFSLIECNDVYLNLSYITSLHLLSLDQLSKPSNHDESLLWRNFSMLLGQAWENGATIEWKHFFDNQVLQKIALPTTVFQKQRAWIDPSPKVCKTNAATESICSHYAIPYWELNNLRSQNHLSSQEHWLIFAGEDPLSEAIVSYLRKQNQNIVILTKKNKSIFMKESTFSFDANIVSECQMAKRFVESCTKQINHIIYLWSFASPAFEDIILIKNILKYILSIAADTVIPMYLFTRQTALLSEADSLCPENALLLGLSRVIPQEYPIKTKIFDIEKVDLYLSKDIHRLIIACLSPTEADFFSYRNGLLFSQRFKPWESDTKQEISSRCTIFITGGTGRIGLQIARHFAKQYQAHIVLLAHAPQDTTFSAEKLYAFNACREEFSHKQQTALASIDQNAASLSLLFGDVASLKTVEKGLRLLLEKGSHVDFVFHLAARLDSHSKQHIADIDLQVVREQWQPKILGVENIHQLTKKYPVKNSVVFSSISSVLGGTSMGVYAGVSAALDACIISYQPDSKTNWFCLNWHAWKMDKMSNDSTGKNTALEGAFFTVEQPTSVLFDFLMKRPTHINTPVFISLTDTAHQLNFKNTLLTSSTVSKSSKKNRSQLMTLSNDEIKAQLKAIFQLHLGAEINNDDADFYQYGGDSLLGLELLESIEKTFAIKLSASFILQYRSIHSIADALLALKQKETELVDSSKNEIACEMNGKAEVKGVENQTAERPISSTALMPSSSEITQQRELASCLDPSLSHLNATDLSDFIVPMNTVGCPPLFFLHPLSGMNACYIDLANALNKKYTCYSIQDPNINGTEMRFRSLEEMAQYYLKLIRTVQPTGRYVFVGYSFGGSLGHAMVSLLNPQESKKVQLFAIDAWATFSNVLRDHDRFQKSIQKHITEIKKRTQHPWLEKDLVNLLWQRMKLLFVYQPRIIHSDIYLLKAEKILPEYSNINESFNHWRQYTKGSVKVYLSPECNHDTILSESISKTIADVILG